MRLLRNFVLFIAVILTWAFMANYFGVLTYWRLVPWDTAIIRPDIGTWQRTLNDFFEVGFGKNLIFLTIALATALPILRTLRRRWDASLRVVVANLLFDFLGFGFLILLGEFNALLFPITYGELPPDQPFLNHSYTRNVIPLIALSLSYFIWYREIYSLSKHRIKAKNASYHGAVSRLSHADSAKENAIISQDTLASSQQVSTQ